MSEEKLLFAISRILIFLLFFTVNSTSQNNNNPTSSCPPSSCGSITRISFPYRLRSDPMHCVYNDPLADPHANSNYFTLDCQNNQTILNAGSKRYLVQEINYDNYTIRVVDSGINRANLSSCPAYSINTYDAWPSSLSSSFTDYNIPVAFIHCLNPVNASKYVEAAFCGNRSSIFSNFSQIHSYVIAGESISVSDLEESCTIDREVWTSPMRDNSSLAGIYDGLGYGMELSWSWALCDILCDRTNEICFAEWNQVTCEANDSCYINGRRSYSLKCLLKLVALVLRMFGPMVIGALLGLRFLCGFPFLVGLVVYKCRRRHLSMDENIEQFCKGDNGLHDP